MSIRNFQRRLLRILLSMFTSFMLHTIHITPHILYIIKFLINGNINLDLVVKYSSRNYWEHWERRATPQNAYKFTFYSKICVPHLPLTVRLGRIKRGALCHHRPVHPIGK
jgi:hypothetical protein